MTRTENLIGSPQIDARRPYLGRWTALRAIVHAMMDGALGLADVIDLVTELGLVSTWHAYGAEVMTELANQCGPDRCRSPFACYAPACYGSDGLGRALRDAPRVLAQLPAAELAAELGAAVARPAAPGRVALDVIDGPADDDGPEPPDWDPGPECDDVGGMSEYRGDLP